MTARSSSKIVPPVDDPKSTFHKKKGGDDLKTDVISHFKRKLDKKESGYELETETESKVESEVEHTRDITRMTMEEYNR